MIQKSKKNFIVFSAVIFALFLNINHLIAQPDPDPPPSCWPPDTCVPIDAGIGFLLAAGVVYGIKKTKDLNKNQKSEV